MVFTVSGRVGLVEDGRMFGKSGDLDDIRRMAAAGAFGVIRVNGPAADGGDGVVHKSGFVQRVGVDGHLDVELVGHAQASVDGRGRGAPILVQFQAASSGENLLRERLARRRVSFPEKSEVHRPGFGGAEHLLQIPSPGRASGGIGSGGRTRSAADHRGGAVRQRFVDLLRRDEMDVTIDRAGGDDLAFARDHFRRGADDQIGIHSGLRVRIPGLADLHDAAVAHPDIGFHDAPMIDDQRVGDHQVERAMLGFARGRGALAHAVANHLAAAERDLVAVDGVILLHFDDQLRVGQANAIAAWWGRTDRRKCGAEC